MSLTQALNTAMAGLQVTQAGLSVVAGNVANVQTPDYVRKTLNQIETAAGGSISVRVAEINRMLDQLLQTQLRTESSGGAYAGGLSQLFEQLQTIYGAPGSAVGLDAMFNEFATSLQGLLASPASSLAQSNAVNAARLLAQKLNTMSTGIQALRSAAEQGIAADIDIANNALDRIAKINLQVASTLPTDAAASALMDQRDFYINQLANVMGIKVVRGDNNQVAVFTSNGIQLVGAMAAKLSFDLHGGLSPNALWNADPALRGAGTIMLTMPGGVAFDLIAAGGVASGEIGAYLQMRDQILPLAQQQLDEFAARMAQAVSDLTTPGTAVTAAPQTGFDVDTAGLLAGNTIKFTYTDALSVKHNVTIIRVNDPSVLPLSNAATADPSDEVFGVDFTGGMASIVTQLNTALGATGLQFSNPAGTTLRILNNLAGTISVNSASKTQTMTSLTSGNAQLPLFLDGPNFYSGSIAAGGIQVTGFAARIAVNPLVSATPSNLISYQTVPPTAAGDATRPTFLFDQLANTALMFSPKTGIGGAALPYSGTLSAYIGQVMAYQGQGADNAKNLKQGQDIVVNALQQRLNAESGVNIDQEMSNLLNLQSAYGANARIFSAVKEMFATLLNM
jgi:flagellar hook-associated protein 1